MGQIADSGHPTVKDSFCTDFTGCLRLCTCKRPVLAVRMCTYPDSDFRDYQLTLVLGDVYSHLRRMGTLVISQMRAAPISLRHNWLRMNASNLCTRG